MISSLPGCVVVTGSNGGLGARLVKDLLASGVTNVACHYRSGSERVQGILEEQQIDAARHLFRAELTNEEDVRCMCEAIEERLGPVWGVVNLAGGSSNGMSWKLSKREFERVVSTNLIATFLVTREILPALRERGQGRIVNISSVTASTGVAGAAHYCAAKAGIEGFTRAVAQEVGSKRVTVNCIALGYFDEGLIRDVPPTFLEAIKSRILLKRLGGAGELFPLVSYLLDPRSDFMTGQVLHLNGGQYT